MQRLKKSQNDINLDHVNIHKLNVKIYTEHCFNQFKLVIF